MAPPICTEWGKISRTSSNLMRSFSIDTRNRRKNILGSPPGLGNLKILWELTNLKVVGRGKVPAPAAHLYAKM